MSAPLPLAYDDPSTMHEANTMSSAHPLHFLSECCGSQNIEGDSIVNEQAAEDDDRDNPEADVEGFGHYLGPDAHHYGQADKVSANEDISYQNENNTKSTHPSAPVADGLNNTYVQILHTNGIHHMAMVTCYFRGKQLVLMDLVACWLLPASFTKI
ncbi:hypothetical protein CVT25_006938 [Psilocybe cyanescens]|uniref:Uncharacterized protein n=1 Tax=Psilocybe cyanescens TaxID=93625 RepID=A0A409WYE4_PSICY|nr:hypothetical protein CVT25_006938 [Psilocybe cyanescens]